MPPPAISLSWSAPVRSCSRAFCLTWSTPSRTPGVGARTCSDLVAERLCRALQSPCPAHPQRRLQPLVIGVAAGEVAVVGVPVKFVARQRPLERAANFPNSEVLLRQRRLAARARIVAETRAENALRDKRRDPWRWRDARLLWPDLTKDTR